jgi:hypothetical protein
MADGRQPGEGPRGGPSEAEVRAMLAEMREAPAEQVLAEVANVLLQAAQVKLGRPDARVLIDAVAAVAAAAEGRVQAELTAQVMQAVTQLRLAQVEAERELGIAPPAAPTAPTATGGAGGPSAASPPPGATPGAAPGQAGQRPASRLWVPGR